MLKYPFMVVAVVCYIPVALLMALAVRILPESFWRIDYTGNEIWGKDVS